MRPHFLGHTFRISIVLVDDSNGRRSPQMPTVDTKINLLQKYSSLIIRQVSRLKQNGLDNRQIADDVLIPLSEVEEILAFL